MVCKPPIKERRMNAVGIAIFTSIIIVAMVMWIAAYGQVEQILNLKSQAQVALAQALRDAASQRGTVLGYGTEAINSDAAMDVFDQDMNNWLSSAPAGVSWQAEAFQVYQDDMAGTPAPGDIPGDIPGPAVYARVDVFVPVLNIPLLQQDVGTGTITAVIEDMESANKYHNGEHTWNGG